MRYSDDISLGFVWHPGRLKTANGTNFFPAFQDQEMQLGHTNWPSERFICTNYDECNYRMHNNKLTGEMKRRGIKGEEKKDVNKIFFLYLMIGAVWCGVILDQTILQHVGCRWSLRSIQNTGEGPVPPPDGRPPPSAIPPIFLPNHHLQAFGQPRTS